MLFYGLNKGECGGLWIKMAFFELLAVSWQWFGIVLANRLRYQGHGKYMVRTMYYAMDLRIGQKRTVIFGCFVKLSHLEP